MRDLLRQVGPVSITDLCALYAAYMAGELARCRTLAEPMGRNTQVAACETPLPEAANHVVAETYGLLVYQEQVLEVLHWLGGFEYRVAERARRAFGKRNADVIASFREPFV